MDNFLKMQIANMIMMLNNFESAIKYAADEEDKKITKKLEKATEQFRKELEKL